jgi:hypothetical protein
VATGGTETYDQIDAALAAVKELDYSFVITSQTATAMSDTNVLKIKAHVDGDAIYDKTLFVYGDDFSIDATATQAKSFNDEKVVIVHGAIEKESFLTTTHTREWGAFFNMCMLVGRLAGLAPQVPLTFKAVDIKGLKTIPTSNDKEKALSAGVLTVIFDYTVNDFVVLQDVNTLQTNSSWVNPDGTSFAIQFNRIKAQLNKELIINSRKELLSDEDGTNRSTLSVNDLSNWTKGYLQRRLATKDSDNLILSYQNVITEFKDGAYWTSYEFVPNAEVTQLLFTGFAI